MSEGHRYFRVALGPHPDVPRVNHREWGVIPGCAPAVDVFAEREISQVRYFNDQQIKAYAKAIRDDGPWPQTLSSIKNPAPKGKGNYYLT